MSEEGLRVLLVDDERFLREPLARRLKEEYGYQVDPAATEAEAWQLVTTAGQPYDVALIDDLLTPAPDREPEPRGVELVERIRQRCPETECIIFTGWGMERELPALRAGAYRYLAKPFRYDELAMLIRSAAHQVRLRAIGRAILSERDLDQVLEQINGAARSLALADEAAIVLLEPGSGRLRIHATTHATGSQWREHFQGQSLSREIIRTGQVVRISDTAQDRRVSRQVVDTGIRSFVGLPIPGEGGNLGVLYVYSHRPGRFDEWGTVAVLQTLAGQAGLAIANAQAFQQLQVHARYMEALVRAGEGLTRATRLEEQLALAWDFVREQLKVSTFFVALYNRETDILRFPLYYDEGKPVMRPDRHIGDDREQWGLAGYVVKTGQELYWPTDEDKQRDCCGLGIKPKEVGKPCQSCFFLPLKIGGQVVGVISIQSYTPHAFSPILLDAVRTLGSQLSVALENTRLISELVEAKEWREALIENAFDAVIAIDRQHHITLFNRRAEEMLGWKAEEMIGHTVARLHREVGQARQIFERVNQEGAVSGLEVELKHRDGTPIPALLSATLIRDSQGHPIGQAGFMRDLRQVRLFEDRQRALFKVSQAITSVLELDEVLELVIHSALAAFPAAHGGSIHLYDERADLLCVRSNTFGYSPEAADAFCLRPGEGVAGWVFRHRQPAVVEDVQRDPRYKKFDHPQAPAHRSIICVPLQVRGQVIGTLSLDNLEAPAAFQADDVELLSTFADQAAIAIDNARRVLELEQMRQAAEAMSRVFEPRQALQQIVDSAAQVLGADSAALWSYDEVRDLFIPEELVAVGIPPEELDKFREEEPKPGRTADTVMQRGYVAVTEISRPEYDFLGQPTRDLLNRIGVRSFQGIALRVGDERLGVLYANYRRLRSFGQEEERKLRTFASHAALTLKNARLLAQMQRTREAAGAIAGVTLQEKLDQTLKTIARHTQQVLGSDVVTLYSYDEATGRFGEWATEIRDPRRPDSARPPEKLKPDSVVWSILNLAESPYYYPAEDHAAGDRLLGGRFVCVEEIRAALGIQLRVGGRKVGVMFVDFRSPHHFTADEIATIQLFADQAAVAIRNARQYDEIVRDARLRQGLLQAGRQIMALQEPKVVLQNVVHIMREVVACDVVTLYTYDQDRGEIGFPAYVAGRLRDRQSLDELGYVSKDSVVGKLLASGQPHFADHAPDDPVMSAGGFVAREGIQSSAGIPLKFGERVLGVMFVNYRAFHPFPAQEQEALLLFASQAAMAIQNARQYGELRRTKGLVGARTALAWMGMTSSAWRHAIDKHALTIREQVELLRRDRERTTARLRGTRMEERLSTIERLANQILEKPIIPPLSREEGLELVALNDLVGERARQLWQNDPYRKAQLRLDLQLPASATVQASPDWLRRALDILVDNAVEAVAGREVQEVTIGTRVANGGAEISVTDTGPGIPEEIRARIGLEPIERPEDAKGLGMGLLMAQTIVQTYGGELRVAATGPTGTTMVLWLPLTPQGKTEEITHAD
mgnify:CR=1 FL=1